MMRPALLLAVLVPMLVACKKDSGESELAEIADSMCRCKDYECGLPVMVRFQDWEKRFPDGASEKGAVASVQKLTACMTAATGSHPAPPVIAVDAAVAAAAPIDAPPPPVPPVDAPSAEPPPIEGRPAGVTDAQIAKLDATIAAIKVMSAELAATDDCKLAAQIVLKHWKGFKPLKKVMRESNPKRDPAIDDWFGQGYLRRGLGAMNPFMNKACDGPEWEKAGDVQDFLGLKTVR